MKKEEQKEEPKITINEYKTFKNNIIEDHYYYISINNNCFYGSTTMRLSPDEFKELKEKLFLY